MSGNPGAQACIDSTDKIFVYRTYWLEARSVEKRLLAQWIHSHEPTVHSLAG